MSNEKGRTKWDFINENKRLVVILLVIICIVATLILNKYNIEFNGIKITSKEEIKKEVELPKVENKKEPIRKESRAEKKYSFLLVLNSDQFDSKILIDGKPAKILKGPTQFTEIEIEQLNKEYSIQLTNSQYKCNITKNIFENRQKIYPCDQY